VINRSVVQSDADGNHQNKQVSFKTDLQERSNRLDVKTSPITRNKHHEHKIRGPYNHVSNRIRSKVGHNEQNLRDRTRSILESPQG
jgi:hypothetical protein